MKTQALLAALVGILVLVLGIVLHERPAEAKTAPRLVRAQEFQLVDGRGVMRARINLSQGHVVLRLFDETGTLRVKLDANRDGSGLLLADETTQPGVQILATRDRTMLALQRGTGRRELTP
jgi:hypothetical protein